jgi:prepilin-type N-terminal cleavage/methylation domain-containing protein
LLTEAFAYSMTYMNLRRGLGLRPSKGFTLIELLVVIAIIGILSSIVLASLQGARAKGRDARRVADIKQLQLALELYYDANSAYPATIGFGASSPLVSNGYISVIPSDPSVTPACTDGTQAGCYKYAAIPVNGNCTSYHIGATLEAANAALASAPHAAASGTVCSGSATDFDGTPAQMFDAKP